LGFIFIMTFFSFNLIPIYIYRSNRMLCTVIFYVFLVLLIKCFFSTETYNEFLFLIFTGISIKLIYIKKNSNKSIRVLM
jgi:hypothetical protein